MCGLCRKPFQILFKYIYLLWHILIVTKMSASSGKRLRCLKHGSHLCVKKKKRSKSALLDESMVEEITTPCALGCPFNFFFHLCYQSQSPPLV